MKQESAEAMRMLTQAFVAQAPPAGFASPDGLDYVVEVDPEPGIRRRIAPREGQAGGHEMVHWDPVATRPATFPEYAPFLPNLTIVTMVRRGSAPMTTTVFTPAQADPSLVDRLLEAGRASGWNDAPMQRELPSFMGTARIQRRGARVRTINEHAATSVGTGVMVMDMPTQADGTIG